MSVYIGVDVDNVVIVDENVNGVVPVDVDGVVHVDVDGVVPVDVATGRKMVEMDGVEDGNDDGDGVLSPFLWQLAQRLGAGSVPSWTATNDLSLLTVRQTAKQHSPPTSRKQAQILGAAVSKNL